VYLFIFRFVQRVDLVIQQRLFTQSYQLNPNKTMSRSNIAMRKLYVNRNLILQFNILFLFY